MKNKKFASVLAVALSALTFLASTQASANPRGRGWRGAGSESWDSRFDWNSNAPTGGRSFRGGRSETYDSRWDFRGSSNPRGRGWRGAGSESWDSRFDWHPNHN